MYEVVGDPPPVPPLYLGVVEEGDAPGSSLPHGVLASSQRPVRTFNTLLIKGGEANLSILTVTYRTRSIIKTPNAHSL